jgi:protein NrfD
VKAQTRRQWMVTHEWMTKPMHQVEWIQSKGLLIWLAEVFSALGTGLYIVALVMGDWWGCLIGWLLILVFKLPMHIAYLGKPTRFWRMFPPFTKAWKTSWFARGAVFTFVFGAAAFVQLILGGLINWDVATGSGITVFYWIFAVIAGVFAVATSIYCGFAMSYCKSVPFWNTGLLPVVFLIMGIADGMALMMAIGLAGDDSVNMENLESASRIALVANAVLIIAYLINATYQSDTAGYSVTEMIKGAVAPVFWTGVVLLGIVTPLAISIASLFTGELAAAPLLITAVCCHTIGAFALKYCVLKVGIYRPILPRAEAY